MEPVTPDPLEQEIKAIRQPFSTTVNGIELWQFDKDKLLDLIARREAALRDKIIEQARMIALATLDEYQRSDDEAAKIINDSFDTLKELDAIKARHEQGGGTE